MAANNNNTRKAVMIILLVAGICVIAVSAMTWQASQVTREQGVSKAQLSSPLIHVDSVTGLQYFYNHTAGTVNTGSIQPRGTLIPVKNPVPVPTSSSVAPVTLPSTGSSVTPVNSLQAGYSGRVPAPVRLNTTKYQKTPVSSVRPVVSKPLPTLKPSAAVIPMPTLLPVTTPTPVPATIIVDEMTRQVEQRIFYYTNIERANSGKPALVWDEQLAVIGRDHSIDMAGRGFFNHINPDGETPADRAIRHGYNVELDFGTYTRVGVGENIAMLTNYPGTADELAKFMVAAWMDSPGHRANIIDTNEQKFTRIGIGVAHDVTTDTWYASQEFF